MATDLQTLFNMPVVVVDDDWAGQSLVSRSLVSQGGGDERLTNGGGVGGWLGDLPSAPLSPALRALLPALVARVVAQPVQSLTPLAQYERIVAVRVVPRAAIDPVIPLIMGGGSPGYAYWYQRYWRALMGYLGNDLYRSRRRLEQLQRRLMGTVMGLGLSAREVAFFGVWLKHGGLGDYVWRLDNEAVA